MEKKPYIEVYRFAEEFLDGIIKEHKELNREILEAHLKDKDKFDNIADANRRLISSLKNRGMMDSVIGFDKREQNFKQLLFDYEPKLILANYSDSSKLFDAFKKNFDIKNINSRRNLWKKFAEGIISGAKFMSIFNTKTDFDDFIKNFRYNKYTKAALPMLLSKEIDGFGFALACDFLKELGYREYPKPDRHLIKIFTALGLSASNKPYEVYKAIIEMSEAVGQDAYTVDKTFYLIGSGNFYREEIKIGRNADKFIKEAKTRLKN